jgi:hypothetical protein
MKTALIVVTLAEVAVLVLVLAGYLIAIGATLRTIARTLGLVTFGVRAIEKQTEPIGPMLQEVNGALAQVADALGAPSQLRVREAQPEAIEHGPTREVSGGAG